ncbi:hypothetical protein EDC04DRAFT_2898076 [Pisolithus marmoratus]|nr:hypothetical protein EDC04DRAFT_2898076 [Pisolithus marmoratus]
MKLLHVEVVLGREKHIEQAESDYDALEELDDEATSYAILSHRWGEEVMYKEMIGLMKMETRKKDEVRKCYGYQKIIKSCEQAMKDGYKWLWIDTCCIDKRSSSELDVDELAVPAERDYRKFGQSSGWPKWFMRGWTLQELIAPKQVEFFNQDWTHIGSKRLLAPTLEVITGIPREVLRDGLVAKRLSLAQIMSWEARRKTTRVEDRAYSLMGLFGVNMPMVYGEGKKAFQWLQLEIIRVSSDHSIFAWRPLMPRTGGVLAEDPSDFRYGGRIRKIEPDEFVGKLMEYIESNKLGDPRRIGILRFDARIHRRKLAVLRDAVHSQQFRAFTVSNAGIQAILACAYVWGLVTIDLVFSGSSFDRIPDIDTIPRTHPEFKTLYLTHHQDANEKRREFILDDKHALYHGFKRRNTLFPRKFTGDVVGLSSITNDLVVIVYANEDTRSCFAVGLGYYLGQGWVHVVYDGHLPTQEEHWTGFGRRVYNRIWKARAKHAQSMPKYQHVHRYHHFVKHVHFPRSVWAAKVVWGRWEMDNFQVMVDVEQCPGCCDGPCGWTTTSNYCGGLRMPGLMNTVPCSYSLTLDGWEADFSRCSGQRIALGDYGDYSDGILKCTGNVIEDMRTLGINPEDSAYCPVVSQVSGFGRLKNDLAVAYHTKTPLALRQPKGISLPANEHFVLLLKALSYRLAGKHLVVNEGIQEKATDSGNHSTEAGILTPFCKIASPQVWRRELPCMRRRVLFESIREHFYGLANMPTGTERRRKSANRRKKDTTIKFFSDMFGLNYLRNYIGDITFFSRFPQMMEADPPSDIVSVVLEDGLPACPPNPSRANWVMRCNPFKSSPQSNVVRLDPRLEAVLPLLRRRCQTLGVVDGADGVSRRYDDEIQKVEHEFKSISQTLGADLLEHITIAFDTGYWEHESSREATGLASRMYYDRQFNIPSMIQEIEVLQVKLDATEDKDEQRALEEDVTGKAWTGRQVITFVRRSGWSIR